MHTIDLAYVGRGLHEELVAYIADQEGYYADEGVHVALHDGIAWDEERLRHGATIGLGRALLSRLTGGIPWVTLSVNTHRPLFWFLARPGLTSLTDLAGQRLAVHAPDTPPGCFARIVLRRAGLDPDRDVHCVVRRPGDYGMDLRQLRDGSIDAAYVGSTMAPEAVAVEYGWQVLAWVGDHFQIPTVGVAVDPTHIQPDDPAVQALIRAHRRALRVIHEDPDTTVRHMRTFLGGQTADEVRAHYEKFIAPYYTTDGKVDLAVADSAIPAVAAELGVSASVDAADLYR
jgi:NitT/TauT family transport system substrate-binding protein